MADRRGKRASYTIDVAIFTPVKGQLAVLLRRTPDAREKWSLPWDTPSVDDPLAGAAARVAMESVGAAPAWIEQVGAFADGRRHPAENEITVAFVALAPLGTPPPVGGNHAWFPLSDLPQIPARQRAILDSAVSQLRYRMDQAPVAFRLLPLTFTLSELQQIYELLLGKKLHKASFRRALQAAYLVEPTDEWRSEGRGRPAQLYRFAPRKRRPAQRGIRFDLLA